MAKKSTENGATTKTTGAALIKQFENEQLRDDVTDFNVGDTVEVRSRIPAESTGKKGEEKKERTHAFTGIVIARKGGGLHEMFTVRRIVGGEGVERTYPLHSPAIVGIKVVRRGDVRRAKLHYLRQRVGKATRVKERLATKAAPKARAEAEADSTD
jgi:large subunit ribosomal protein L19